MNFRRAVSLARQGKEDGFKFLYDSTYKDKFYIALKYVGNEEDAQDVLQDAYVKAFSKLDTLEEPERFPNWMGTIVANTAKDSLKKKKPLLFSELGLEEEGKIFEYEIEDDSSEYQPEEAYTRQETAELVNELINALSDEQRMCILMFHIEGQSIKEIAETLECSQTAVKSRLFHGREKIKKKAEELQKKGHKIYSIAPIPLLLYLLGTEKAWGMNLAAQGSLAFSSAKLVQYTGSVGKGLLGNTLIQGTTAKVVAIATSLAVAGGTTGAIIYHQKNNPDSKTASVSVAKSTPGTFNPENTGIDQMLNKESSADVTEEETVTTITGDKSNKIQSGEKNATTGSAEEQTKKDGTLRESDTTKKDNTTTKNSTTTENNDPWYDWIGTVELTKDSKGVTYTSTKKGDAGEVEYDNIYSLNFPEPVGSGNSTNVLPIAYEYDLYVQQYDQINLLSDSHFVVTDDINGVLMKGPDLGKNNNYYALSTGRVTLEYRTDDNITRFLVKIYVQQKT